MKRLTGLPAQLVSFMQSPHVWHAKGKLTADMQWKHQRGKNYGKRYLPETVGRALRSLEENRVIAVKADGISVQYKWLPSDMRKRYIPSSQRVVGYEDILFELAH